MSKNPSFVVGDTILFTAQFRVDDVLTNPTATTFTIEEPDGTNNTPAVTAVSTGIKTASFTPDQVGYHHWRWDGTGAAAGRREGTIYVHASAIT